VSSFRHKSHYRTDGGDYLFGGQNQGISDPARAEFMVKEFEHGYS
jgi:hypothetical protein